MLAFMHEAEPYGHLRLNGKDIGPPALARMVGSALKETEHLLNELEDAGVFSRTEQGTIFSRRMVRDQILREKRGQYGHLSARNPSVPRKKRDQEGYHQGYLPPILRGVPFLFIFFFIFIFRRKGEESGIDSVLFESQDPKRWYSQ